MDPRERPDIDFCSFEIAQQAPFSTTSHFFRVPFQSQEAQG
jgi:hypothetical protein